MKSKATVVIYLLLISTALIYLGGCKKDPEEIFKRELSGYVQKGPYVSGSSVSMYELNSSLEQTGKTFNSQINDNSGSFDFGEVGLKSKFVEFNANGFYFDEVRGALSVAPLNLYALSDITNSSTVNVNILTHLERPRVQFLTKNKTFDEAKKIAQAEILALFGITSSEIVNSEALDISSDDEENGILLAISIIIQHDLSVAQLTELLATISNDLKNDGNVDATIISNLRTAAIKLDLQKVRSNLLNRYSDIGSTITIPPFEQYVNQFLTYTGQKPTSTTSTATSIATTSVKLNGVVNPNSLTTAVSFEYGKTNEYTNTSPSTPVTANIAVPVSATISELEPGTTYHYRLKAENSLGITYSSDLTFKTLGGLPVISNPSVSDKIFNEGTFSCEINYSLNPNYFSTEVALEWGTTTSYGNTVNQPSPLTGSSTQSIATALTGLSSGVTYYFRVKSINQFGETQATGTIQSLAPVTDIDGNVYDVIVIGGQYWITKNLRTTRLNDGTPIQLVEDGSAWNALTSPGYCWYNNDPSDKIPYGGLYNWYTVDTKKLCPTGWHVPSTPEWQALINYFGDVYKAAYKLEAPETGFGLIQNGLRYGGVDSYRNATGNWWASTLSPSDPAKRMGFSHERIGLVTAQIHYTANTGMTVRCLKD